MAEKRVSTMHNVLVMALADGRINEDEKQHIERMRDRLGISAEQFKKLIQGVRDGARPIRLPASPAEAQQVLLDLIEVCQADGRIEEGERRVLEKIARHLGVPDAALEGMLRESTGVDEEEMQGKIDEIYVNFSAWDPDERRRRVAELAAFGPPAVVPLLRAFESYRAPDGAADALELKIVIVDTLAGMADRRAVYYLANQVALSENSEVSNDDLRYACAEAIGRLVGKTFARDGAGVAAAQQWWKAVGMKEYVTLGM